MLSRDTPNDSPILPPSGRKAAVNNLLGSSFLSSATGISGIDTDLADIFHQSEELWLRKRLTSTPAVAAAQQQAPRTSSDSFLYSTPSPFLRATMDAERLANTSLSARPASTTPSPPFSGLMPRADRLPISGMKMSGEMAWPIPIAPSSSKQQGHLAINAGQKQQQPFPYDPLCYSAAKDIDRCVKSSVERTRLETEQLQRQQLQQQRAATDPFGLFGAEGPAGRRRGVLDFGPAEGVPAVKKLRVDKAESRSRVMGHEEGIFAKKVDSSLTTNCNAPLKDSLLEAVLEIDDREITLLWEKVFAVCSRPLLQDSETVAGMRSSGRWMSHVVDSSVDYLQRQYKEHMEVTVRSNLMEARRGGKPTPLSLVTAYLNVLSKRPLLGKMEQQPDSLWPLVFYSMRIGEFETAYELLLNQGTGHETENGPMASLLDVLDRLREQKFIEMDLRNKLAVEWRNTHLTCEDDFKRAIYGVLLGFEVAEVNSTIEDWLWARLTACRSHPQGSDAAFRQLQANVCVDYGEKYFLRSADGVEESRTTGGSSYRNHLLYFSALMLTGQVERAIYALAKAKLTTHAVHVALHCYQMKLLVLCEEIEDELLTIPDILDRVKCQFNLPRLVVRYVDASVEPCNLHYALNYYFLLHKFDVLVPKTPEELDEMAMKVEDGSVDGMSDQRGTTQRSLLQLQLVRLILRHSDGGGRLVDELLGKLNSKGERQPGIMDKFSSAINLHELVAQVAKDVAGRRDAFRACQLYVLADRPNEAAKLVCGQLGASAADPSSEQARRSVEMAEWIGCLYASRGEAAHTLALLNQLLHIHTFFRHVAARDFDAALKLMEELKLLPFNQNELQAHVTAFEMVPTEVRGILPDLCVSTMRSIAALYERAGKRRDDETQRRMKGYAETIVLFGAMIPYSFPVSTISTMLQFQSQIA